MGAPADGYTFIVTDGSIVSTNPALFKQLTYNPKDIVPVALLGRTPMFLASHPSLPVSTLARVRRLREGASGRDQLRLVRRRQHRITCRWRR